MIYFYGAFGLVVGVASEHWRLRWTLLVSLVAMAYGVFADVWPHIDWQGGGAFETIYTGFVWNIVPATLFFFVPFICGKYTFRGIRKLLGRRRAGQDSRR